MKITKFLLTLCAYLSCTLWLYAQRNGMPWPDTDGQHINTHGGNVIKYGDRYYWYGENRPDRGFTTEWASRCIPPPTSGNGRTRAVPWP